LLAGPGGGFDADVPAQPAAAPGHGRAHGLAGAGLVAGGAGPVGRVPGWGWDLLAPGSPGRGAAPPLHGGGLAAVVGRMGAGAPGCGAAGCHVAPARIPVREGDRMDGIRMEQFPFRALDYKAGEAWLNELG